MQFVTLSRLKPRLVTIPLPGHWPALPLAGEPNRTGPAETARVTARVEPSKSLGFTDILTGSRVKRPPHPPLPASPRLGLCMTAKWAEEG